MGKASKFKKLRKFASQMPSIQFNAIKGERVEGSVLIARDIKEVEGKPVDEKQVYREKKIVKQPLNHYRKMKEMYKKHGEAGANAYAVAVNNYAVRHNDIKS